MKTIVLDDDPTGTQSASNVEVLLEFDVEAISESLKKSDSVYIQTNSRALDEEAARVLSRKVHEQGTQAGKRLGEHIRFVLRGDSTLRGHVFAETEEFLNEESSMVFVPAFPDGGRTTVNGMHLVRTDGRDIPAHESEYANDPVFPFTSGELDVYVTEKSGRASILVDLESVREGRLASVLTTAPPGSVVIPDAVTNEDISLIAEQIKDAERQRANLVVRGAAPVVAELAGVTSRGLLPRTFFKDLKAVLLVCGSHTEGAFRQLSRIQDMCLPYVIDSEDALSSSQDSGRKASVALHEQLQTKGLAAVASERERKANHNTLWHGERIMSALTHAVAGVRQDLDVLISKGGITSAAMARQGLGATTATVLGQLFPGVSVWRVPLKCGKTVLQVIVPGNVGDEDALLRILKLMNLPVPNQ